MTFLEGLLWLTLNVYHEARSEPIIGQVAVAHVTLNRAAQRDLSIKNVVNQPNQFSWIKQKKSYIPEDPQAFFQCMKSVSIALNSTDFTAGSTFYHLDNIKPYWASKVTFVEQYGSHKFYR